MKDWQFYPLAMALTGAMIWFALSLADHTETPQSSVFVVEGRTLSTLFAAEGTSYSIASDTLNPNAYAVLSAHVSRENAPPSAGVFVTLSPAYRALYATQPLKVTIMARKGRASPLENFDVAYLSTDKGSSGWQTFELTNAFEAFSFVFTPQAPQSEGGSDYVGFWPDVDGKSRTMDLKWIRVQPVSETTNDGVAP